MKILIKLNFYFYVMVSCSFGLLVILAFYIHKNCGGCFEDNLDQINDNVYF